MPHPSRQDLTRWTVPAEPSRTRRAQGSGPPPRRTGPALLAGLMLLLSAPARAGVLYVDAAAPPWGDGLAWFTAYRHLSEALQYAALPSSGITEVRVAQGRYVPDTGKPAPEGSGDRFASFLLPGGVVVRGGYAGFASSEPDAWDPETFVTVLDGDLGDNDHAGIRSDNAAHVVRATGTAPGTRLEGVTIRGGAAGYFAQHPGVALFSRGGGVLVVGGVLELVGCTIADNTAASRGGGVAATQSAHLIVRDCLFERNDTHAPGNFTSEVRRGGSLAVDGASMILEGTIIRNSSSIVGGAIGAENATSLVIREGCQLADNFAEVGGAIRILDSGTVTISDAEFVGNSALAAGGAIFVVDVADFSAQWTGFTMNTTHGAGLGAAVIAGSIGQGAVVYRFRHCRFVLNEGGQQGATLACDRVRLENCMFSRNADLAGAGDVLYADVSVEAVNTSFSGHGAPVLRGGSGVAGFLRNCIVWGVTGGSFAPQLPLTVSHSIIEGGWNGPGSAISVDPRFRDPSADDLRLLEESPAIDAGGNMWLPPGLTLDLDGNPRVLNGVVDMGCYEGSSEPVPQSVSIPYLAPGQTLGVVLGGGVFDPWTKATMVVQNVSPHPTGATVLTQVPPGGAPGGFNLPQGRVCLDSLLLPGQIKARITVPFTQADLDDEIPAAADLAVDHPVLGRWVRAVLGNVSGVHGTRFVSLNGQSPPIPFEVGNFGIAWNPALQRGYVVAVVDRTGDFAMGLPTCPADVALMPDGAVSMPDALFVLSNLGAGYGFADVNHDGIVTFQDLAQVLAWWGPCP